MLFLNFIEYTGCFRRNSKCFRRWYYGLFRVNKFIYTCVQFSMGVETQLFERYAQKSYKRYEGKTNDSLIAFIGYVNDLNKLQQFKVSVKKIPPSTSMHFSTLLAIVRVALLRSSWRSCFRRAALFIMRATNSSLLFTFSL